VVAGDEHVAAAGVALNMPRHAHVLVTHLEVTNARIAGCCPGKPLPSRADTAGASLEASG
jgi:hypothetical protein